jgi:hypothetical protein
MTSAIYDTFTAALANNTQAPVADALEEVAVANGRHPMTSMTTQRRAAQERADRISDACTDERRRFNAAIDAGADVSLPTFSGSYRMRYVDSQWWYHTDGNGGFGQSWCGCNDGTWAGLLAQAGVARNPLFAEVR